MSQKHRKCDTEKFRRRRKAEKTCGQHRLAEQKERERKYNEKWGPIREAARMREREEVLETIRLRRRLVNLLTFRMWQMDPVYYYHWARERQMKAIVNIFARNIW